MHVIVLDCNSLPIFRQVIPYLLKNLLVPEVAALESARKSDELVDFQFSGGVVDPCKEFASVMYKFAIWAFEERGYNQTCNEIHVVALLAHHLQHELKRIFPFKSGKQHIGYTLETNELRCNALQRVTSLCIGLLCLVFHFILLSHTCHVH